MRKILMIIVIVFGVGAISLFATPKAEATFNPPNFNICDIFPYLPFCEEEEEEPQDICPNLEGVQEVLPEGYQLVEGQCIEDTPPIEEPPVEVVCTENCGTPPTFAGSSTNAPVCSDTTPGVVANINVESGTPDDNKVEVQWALPTGANKVHISYGEYGKPYEHALLNTDNDGNEVIGGLKNGVNYNFKVAGVNGCAVGQWSAEFDPKP
jgi:hypothetical protein